MRFKKFLFLGLIIALIVGAIYVGISLFSGKDTRAVNGASKKFIGAVLDSRFEDAYKLTSKDFQTKQNLDEFSAAMGGIATEKPVYEASKTIVTNKSANYFQTVRNLPKTTAGRTDGYFSLLLVNEDGWKVVSAKVR